MMKYLKSILSVGFIFILVVGLSACSSYKYEGKEISFIEYTTIDYNGGYTRETKIDLLKGEVLKREFLPSDSQDISYSLNYNFDISLVGSFLNEVGKAGLFNLKDNYPSPGKIIDGGGWTLIIQYADGSSNVSTGDNNYPVSIFKKADYAFYNLYGDDLFKTLPSSFTKPPSIDIAFNYLVGIDHYSEGYSGLPAINYTWNKSIVTDVDIITYAIQNPLHEFNLSHNYKFVLWTANYEHRFSNVIITSFDLNGNDSRDIDNSGWFNKKEYSLEFNRIYVIKMTFSYGICEYAFSTKID